MKKVRTYKYYTYILTNSTNKVIYTGVTNDLEKRCYVHKNKLVNGFTARYNVNKLVYFEEFDHIESAISREKQIKGWLRVKKINLIEEFNCRREYLYQDRKVRLPSKIIY